MQLLRLRMTGGFSACQQKARKSCCAPAPKRTRLDDRARACLCVRVSDHPELSPQDRRAQLLCKLHLLLGIVPLTAFLTLHLAFNAALALASDSFRSFAEKLAGSPFWLVLEVTLVWVPLVVHVLYVVRFAQPPAIQTSATGILLRRLSGVGTLLFLAYHLLQFRVPLALGQLEAADISQTLYTELSSTTSSGAPLVAGLYLLGLAATAVHVSQGFYSVYAAARPGGHAGPIATALGIVLFGIGAETIIYYATGSRRLIFG
jgi:succinate dehydrogenase / fumarate reductase cytochrome b subunit